MKSMLIIDKPACCNECALCYKHDDIYKDGNNHPNLFCPVLGWVDIELGNIKIQEGCPLKDMPVREPQNDYNFENYKNGIAVGWNDCVDYLLGKGRWERTVANDGKTEETTMC